MGYVSISPQNYRVMFSAIELLREGVSVEMVAVYLDAMTRPLGTRKKVAR